MATKKKARKPYDKAHGRSYAPGSYDYEYNHTKESTTRRADRMRARRAVVKKLTEKHGAKKAAEMMKGKEVDHKKPFSKGGTSNPANLKVISKSANRAKDRPMGTRKKTARKKT